MSANIRKQEARKHGIETDEQGFPSETAMQAWHREHNPDYVAKSEKLVERQDWATHYHPRKIPTIALAPIAGLLALLVILFR